MCEWRGKFGKEAVDVVKAHLESDDEFKDEDGQLSAKLIAEFVEYMLEHTHYGYRFIYEDVDNLKHGFRHPFVSKTLAMHFQQINGSVGLEDLLSEPEDRRPKGALILSCLAVLRALNLFRSGDLATSAADFSGDHNSAERVELAAFIEMKPETWEKVVEAAKAHAPKGIRRSTVRRTMAPPAENRSILREDSDEENA